MRTLAFTAALLAVSCCQAEQGTLELFNYSSDSVKVFCRATGTKPWISVNVPVMGRSAISFWLPGRYDFVCIASGPRGIATEYRADNVEVGSHRGPPVPDDFAFPISFPFKKHGIWSLNNGHWNFERVLPRDAECPWGASNLGAKAFLIVPQHCPAPVAQGDPNDPIIVP
jgi:hypothetical protein